MRMNRRNVLAGIGALTAGGGAVFGSGAFSSVEATRTVDVSTQGDSNALLQLSGGSSEFVSTDGNDLIKISENSLNRDAITTAVGAIQIKNTGSKNVGFYVEDTSNVGTSPGLDFEDGTNSIVGSSNAVNLDSSSSISIDLVFDLTDETDNSQLPGEVVFHADSNDYDGTA